MREDQNSANGYFSPKGISYHSVETLIVEAPGRGHQTSPEAFSFCYWLEATYGRVTGDSTERTGHALHGLSERWNPQDLPGLLQHSSAVVAGHLLRSAGKYHDDASVAPEQRKTAVPHGRERKAALAAGAAHCFSP